MLWYKAWLETRLRFFIGLGLLLFMACGVTFEYRAVQQLMPLAQSMQSDDSLVGRLVQQAVAIQSTYRGFVWYQWFNQNLSQTWALFALLIGTGGLTPQRGALYTLGAVDGTDVTLNGSVELRYSSEALTVVTSQLAANVSVVSWTQR